MWARLIESVVTKDELEVYKASGNILAANVTTDTTDFDGILGAGDTTVQIALDTLDDIDYDDISGNDADTDVTGAELEELSDGSDTTLHGHDVTGLTNWPTIDYSYVSGNDAGTDVSAAELEELTDGSATTLHKHSYSNTVTVAPSGADYTTIQDALDDNGASTLVLVYPGTYANDTVNFTANAQCVKNVGKPNVTKITSSTQVVEGGDYIGCALIDMRIDFTPTTAVNMIEVNNGNLQIRQSRLQLTTSSAIAGATQPAIFAVTGTGEIKTKLGEFYYYHTGNTTTGIKAMFSAGAGSLKILRPCTSVMTNSGTALASTLFVDGASGTVLVSDLCDFTLTDTTASIVTGVGYIGGSGNEEIIRSRIAVVGGGANACYAVYNAGTGTFRSIANEWSVTGGATNNSFFTGAAATTVSEFDNVTAANGTAGTGTFTASYSPADGDFTLTGSLNVSGSFVLPITTQTGLTLTLDATHHTVLCDANSNNVTINLPAASGVTGRIYNIKCIDNTNTVTVDGNGAETIDGSATKTLALNEVITIQCDGSNWQIIGN